MPIPLASNRRAFEAFRIAKRTLRTHPMSGHVVGFERGVLIERLKLRGLWDEDIDDKINILEDQLVRISAKHAEEKAEESKR